MLGPLTNPAGANCQLIGVYAPELTEMFAEALLRLGSRRQLSFMDTMGWMKYPYVPPPAFPN